MQSLLGCIQPSLEPMTIPALRFDQHHPRGLHEQNAQIAVTALRYLAEDGAIARGDLFGHQAEPSRKVAAFGKDLAGSDCGYHSAGDNRANARDAHQSLAARVLPGQSCNVSRQLINALVEPAPV